MFSGLWRRSISLCIFLQHIFTWYSIVPKFLTSVADPGIDVVCAVCAIFFAARVLIGPSVPEVYRWLWMFWLNGIRVVRTSTRIGDIIEIMIEVTRFALPLVLGSLSVMHIYAYVGQIIFCRSNHFLAFISLPRCRRCIRWY